MQLGIFAKTFSTQGAVNTFSAVRKAGYNATQFNMSCVGLSSLPQEINVGVTEGIAQASRSSGVAISAVSATYNMIHPDDKQRRNGKRALSTVIGAARTMGTELVTLCTGTRDAEDQWRYHPDNRNAAAWRDLLVEMEEAADIAEAHSINLGIEPELANVVYDAASARRLVDEIKSSRIRIVLDPANLFEVEEAARRLDIISRSVDLLGDHIAMAHAKDRDATGKFVAAGKGMIDFSHFIGKLKSIGFDGPVITHGLSEDEAPEVARFLTRIVAA